MPKGQQFERDICRRLSLWWTSDFPEPSDSVFWRTSNSGGRATVRGRKGKSTINSHGDVGAVDPVGKPFLDFFTVELKRGYSGHSFADLIDKPDGAGAKLYRRWFVKAEKDAKAAGSVSWLLIVRRDRREEMVFVPCNTSPVMSLGEATNHVELGTIIGLPLSDFLREVQPSWIEKCLKPFPSETSRSTND